MRFFILTFLLSFTLNTATTQSYIDYDWNNVPIGGGGYITGMQIHPMDSDFRFYRTDVGGAYKFNPVTQRMDQLVFQTNKDYYSVAGIALHPSNMDTVYLAVGRYCNPSNNAILRSIDGGQTFEELMITGDVDFHFAANGGRGCDSNADPNTPNNGDKDRQGAPIAINPLNTNELYIGSRENGLYILDLQSLESEQISSTEIPYNDIQYSIRTVLFHPTEPLVYIAYSGFGVYMGDTENRTFWNVDDPANPVFPELLKSIDISISKDADYLIVACKREGLLKCDDILTGNNWSVLQGGLEIIQAADQENEGYLTVACSPHDNDLVVTVTAGWNHIDQFQVSEDAGSTWTTVDGSVPVANNIFPWRSDSFGSHIAKITFDPLQSDRLYFTSWFSTFICDSWDVNLGGEWHNIKSAGHEEIVPVDLIAFPTNTAGNFLIAGSADHAGFIFDDVITEPDSFATEDISDLTNDDLMDLKKSASYAFCENQPDNLAMIITNEWNGTKGGMLTSDDGGVSWHLKDGYDINDKKSLIEISSDDPNNIIVLTEDNLKYSADGGETDFIAASGSSSITESCALPFTVNCLGPSDITTNNINNSVFGAGRNIAADKSTECVFYYYNWDGSFNISTNGGMDWCIVNNIDLPVTTNAWNKTRLISIPEQPGHLWININNSLFFSSNGGTDWTNLSSGGEVNQAKALSFGKGFSETYPALYIYGSIDGVSGDYFYRSDDMGMSWIRISEYTEKELWGDNKIIAGDRNIPGRLYATSSGQGVLYSEEYVEDEPCGSAELILSGTFDNSASNIPDFAVHDSGGAIASGSINANTEAVIDITEQGSFNYNIQLWQDNLSMTKDVEYTIKTKVRADANRVMTIKLRNLPVGTTYLEEDINLTTVSEYYEFTFVAPVDDNELRLTYLMGTSDVDVYFDEISMKEVCETECNLPPDLNYVENITGYSTQLHWFAVDDADKYRIQYREVGSANWSLKSNTNLTVILNDLIPETDYEFRFASRCGTWGDYGPIYTFTSSACVPPNTDYTETLNGYTHKLVLLPVVDAIKYQVQYRPVGSTNWVLKNFNGGNLSRNLINLIPDTDYEYRKRTRCLSNAYTPFSELEYFTTSSCDSPTPTAVTFPNDNEAMVEWSAEENAINYQIRYREAGDPTWIVKSSPNPFKLLVNLDSNTNYLFQLRAKCPSWTPWSSNNVFTTPNAANGGEVSSRQNRISVKVYPNPVTGENIYIDIPVVDFGNPSLSIHDMNGKLLKRVKGSAIENKMISIDFLESGQYFLRIVNDQHSHSVRFIVID